MFFCVSASQPDGESSGTMLFPCIREFFYLQARRFFPAEWWGSFFSRRVTQDSGVLRVTFFFARGE